MNRFAFAVVLLIVAVAAGGSDAVDTKSLRGKVLCGYQGWFRCPGDGSNLGWVHWSRESRSITPATVAFEMWPDLSEFSKQECFVAPGFTAEDGAQASLFSSDNASTVSRHFQWMRDCGIDGVWLQRFVVNLHGGPSEEQYASGMSVMRHVRDAAQATGRVWALTYDMSGMPPEKVYDVLTADWKRLVVEGIPNEPRYLHQDGRPAIQVWGFYPSGAGRVTAATALRLIDFFEAAGPNAAFLIGGGAWDWRQTKDPEWQAVFRRLNGFSPWNVGNVSFDSAGVSHATTNYWAGDKKECESRGMLWIPVIYPGFSWDNLSQKPPGSTAIPRRGGRFFWEQFHAVSEIGADSLNIAMFDEVDEGTAIFKVSNLPPAQRHFVTYDWLPSDWYLRLAGEGARLFRLKQTCPVEIPIQP